MSSLDQLYQQVIIDHARERHGHGLRESADGTGTAESHQYNPLCGDEVTLRVVVGRESDERDVVQDLSWAGDGCSISQASTSVLYDLVVGRTPTEAGGLVDDFRAMIRSRGTAEPDEEVLGDAVAFSGVGRHANRVKCAMLGWTAFEDALARAVGSERPAGLGSRSETDPVESETDPVESETDPVESETDPVESETDPVESETDPVEEA